MKRGCSTLKPSSRCRGPPEKAKKAKKARKATLSSIRAVSSVRVRSGG
ncbi:MULTISPECIES: hypothetical protein [unclassified Streptomyces]|nr:MULTISPECIES: hypothetical protein [unclassified Streptomyces]